AVPVPLIGSTVHAAIGSAAISPAVGVLFQGASNAMLLKSLKSAAVLSCGVMALVGVSVGLTMHVVAAHAAPGRTTQPAGADAPAGQRAAPPHTIPAHVKLFFPHPPELGRMVHDELGSTAAADDKDKPALSGAWLKKDAELKIEFAGKDVMKISPHNKDDLILILCEYTTEKDGLVKAKITGFEGKEEV